MTQPAPTPTEPVVPDPGRTARHVLRTVLQVLIAEAAAIPSLSVAFGLSAATTGKISGSVGLVVVLVTTLQNAGEDAGIIPTILGNPVVKWVQQQIETGQPIVVPPAPVPGDPTPVPTTDPVTPDDDPPADEPGTPSAGNETSVRAPRKRAPAKKTVRKRTTTRKKD